MAQAQPAKVLAVTQARVSDIKRGKISSFSLDLLVRLAARAGLKPQLRLVAQAAGARSKTGDSSLVSRPGKQ